MATRLVRITRMAGYRFRWGFVARGYESRAEGEGSRRTACGRLVAGSARGNKCPIAGRDAISRRTASAARWSGLARKPRLRGRYLFRPNRGNGHRVGNRGLRGPGLNWLIGLLPRQRQRTRFRRTARWIHRNARRDGLGGVFRPPLTCHEKQRECQHRDQAQTRKSGHQSKISSIVIAMCISAKALGGVAPRRAPPGPAWCKRHSAA
jgi:hypothetical protein